MAQAVLAVDQGTTGTTAMVLDAGGRILGRAYGEIRQFYPRPGWVEHDPEEIYRSVVRLSRAAIAAARIPPSELGAVGITNQRETFVVWDRRTGATVHRAIVWQCRRSAAICAALARHEAEVRQHTGLLIDPYFAGTKLKWLLDSRPELRRRGARGQLCFGTVDSWLVFKLSRGERFVTDFTNASRTMMLNLKTLTWEPAMLRMLGVPVEMLPEPVRSRGPLAETAPGTLAPRSLPIGSLIGDQQAALYGHGAVHAGQAKATYGTGAFLLMHTGGRAVASRNRLLTTVALGPGGEPEYALEGSVFIAGAVIQWLRDEMHMLASSKDSEKLARQSPDRTHPYLVPAFVGLGAPYWDSAARGALVGITRGTNRADVVRAALDSIAYQLHDVVVAMESDTGRPIRELMVDGGACANDYLMQFQADILGRRVRRPKMVETTVLGAAMLAGLAAGIWRAPKDLQSLGKVGRVFRSAMPAAERNLLVEGWRAAVARVRSGN
jgi:glycerol kinase